MLQLAIGYLRSHDVFAAGLAALFLVQLLTIAQSRRALSALRKRVRGLEASMDQLEGEQSARVLRAATRRSFEADAHQASVKKAQQDPGNAQADRVLVESAAPRAPLPTRSGPLLGFRRSLGGPL
jgi:hypothetical protein